MKGSPDGAVEGSLDGAVKASLDGAVKASLDGAVKASPPTALEASFYARPVVEVSRDLVGCVVRHGECAGVIVETEAYHDSEPACHAFVGLTPRTATLFGPPGRGYVYRSYGVHALLNAVCEPPGVGAAALIRALEPIEGIELMQERRGVLDVRRLCSGPGNLTVALGIGLADNGVDLRTGSVTIGPRPAGWERVQIAVDRRIGINKAVELPWRFCARGSRFLSRPVRRVRSAAAESGAAGPRARAAASGA
jgi:DNA-3-methyladenine glycosylase